MLPSGRVGGFSTWTGPSEVNEVRADEMFPGKLDPAAEAIIKLRMVEIEREVTREHNDMMLCLSRRGRKAWINSHIEAQHVGGGNDTWTSRRAMRRTLSAEREKFIARFRDPFRRKAAL